MDFNASLANYTTRLPYAALAIKLMKKTFAVNSTNIYLSMEINCPLIGARIRVGSRKNVEQIDNNLTEHFMVN